MKKYLLFTLLLLFVVSSCKTKEDQPKFLDPNTKLEINIKDGLRTEGAKPWTPLEIVEKATRLHFVRPGEDRDSRIGIAPNQRDYVRMSIVFPSDYIIRSESAKHPERKILDDYFIASRDVLLTYARPNYGGWDTIAYIPNATVERAYKDIHAAWDRGDIESVYRLFQEAFVAIPITGEQYKTLKVQGKN